MNYLLFGGASNVGKSGEIIRLEEFLNSKGLRTSDKHLLQNDIGDFYAYFDGKNSQGTKIRILVSSAADMSSIIQGFKKYCKKHEPYDFIISAIRDDGDPERDNFFSTMGITSSDYVLEIPMGKITKRREDFYTTALDWYRNMIDNLAHTILGNAPFFI